MKGQKFVLWILAGAGVILMYSAYHNVSPTSLLAKYAGLSSSLSPLTGTAPNTGAPKGGSTGKGSSGGGGGGGGGGAWGDSQNYGQQYLNNIGTVALDPYTNDWQQYDQNGYAQGAIPAGYQVSPGTYIAGVNV